MFTKPFSELNKNSVFIAGGKGASLGEMRSSGIPVPDGFVVLSTTFDEFLHITDLTQEIEAILKNVDHQTVSSVDKASEKIQALIRHANMPNEIANEIQTEFKKLDSQFVAVRSSATAEDGAENAWAGQLDSFLNTTNQDLLEKVQHCWASLFTPRAIFYRFEKGLNNTKISVAVVVQKMVDSEKSGIVFSVHPVTEDPNQLIIEAGFGLGEAIVSGQITPDSYVVEKKEKKIIDLNVSNQDRAIYRKEKGGNEWQDIPDKADQQVLTEKEILELSDIILKIENHYGFPCDIEWAFEQGKFYVVQSRPITTLTKKEDRIEEGVVNLAKAEKLVFEKTITRDWTLLTVEIWHEIYTDEFFKQFKWKYTDGIFEGKNGAVTIYRAPAEHMEGMKNFIIRNLENDGDWILKQAEIVEKEYNLFVKWLEGFESRNIGNLSFVELKSIIEKIFSKSVFLGPRFLIMMWFPIQMENDERKEKFEQAIERAVISRRRLEALLPLSDEIIRKSLEAFSNLVYLKNKKLIKYVSHEDLLDFPKKNKLEEALLEKRKEHFIFCNDGLLFDDLKIYMHRKDYALKENNLGVVNQIKGNIAYGGIVSGRVRIIILKDELRELKDGEILITSMTTPEFLPALKKAIAFVTDEGGVTCHAAIVARELRKPCIIGTKIATQVLHDGDLVEVDADNGVVRIFERAEMQK